MPYTELRLKGHETSEDAQVLRTPEPGSNSSYTEPMNYTRRATDESVDAEAAVDAALFSGLSIRNAECPVCGHVFEESDSVRLYVCRAAGQTRFEIGRAVCGDDAHALRSAFTLGTVELLIEGRVGRCSDAATQSSWLALVAPRIVGVSGVAAKAVCTPRTGKTDDSTTTLERPIGAVMKDGSVEAGR